MAYNFEKEKREAIDAGNKALESLRTAKENLDSAHNWGLFDMFAGGLISSLAKRSKMNRPASIWSRPNGICEISARN